MRAKVQPIVGIRRKPLNVRLAIGIPCTDAWQSLFGLSLQKMFLYRPTIDFGVNIESVQVLHKKGSMLARMRYEMVEQALASPESPTHLLFIDSDQTFPAETAYQLLRWRKPVVACNVAIKTIPSGPTARLHNPNDPKGTPLFTRSDSDGLVRVWRVGTGVMAIDLDVFKKIPRPWFLDVWREKEQRFQGEDWYFCQLCEKAGIPIFVDQSLSWRVGHVGAFPYEHAMIEQQLEIERIMKEREGGLKHGT